MQTSISTHVAAVAMALMAATSGCSNHGQVELLEGQLRDREDQIATLQDEVESQEHEARVAKEEAEMLRQQLASTGNGQAVIQLTSGVARVDRLSISKSMTGFLDIDEDGAPDQLMVLIQPKDERGEIVEVAGQLHVKLGHEEQTINRWAFTPSESRQRWRGNKLGTGIMLELDLKQPLPKASITIEVELTTFDEQKFKATHTL